MRSIYLTAAVLMLASACVINNKDDDASSEPMPGDITFLWSFEGQTCAEESAVRQVRVYLQGSRGAERLDQDGYYSCNTGGIDGIKLFGFEPGNYTFTIDALDGPERTAKAIYTTTGTVTVDGDVSQKVTLNRIGARGFAKLQWVFDATPGAHKTCTAAGIASGADQVSEVRVSVNGRAWTTYSCAESPLLELEPVKYHEIDLEGIMVRTNDLGVSERQVWYSAHERVSVLSGKTEVFTVAMLPAASGATFPFEFRDAANAALLCSGDPAIKLISVQLTSWGSSPMVLTGFGDCAQLTSAGGFASSYLPAYEKLENGVFNGTWTVRMQAWDSINSSSHRVLYESAPTVYSVAAGQANQLFAVPVVLKKLQ